MSVSQSFSGQGEAGANLRWLWAQCGVLAIPHRGKQAFVLTFTLPINLEKPVDRIHKEETGVPGGKLCAHTESLQTPGLNPAILLTTTPLSYPPFYVDWC